jgi:NNP family nitrate/nitrite transporter-like MFS transporter
LGGVFSDRLNKDGGLRSRVRFLFLCLLLEGVFLIVFSQMTALWIALPMLIIFSLFVQMSEGATFAIVPYINKRSLGAVSGIVGAGGNVGAMLAGFLFKYGTDYYSQAYLLLGFAVIGISFFAFAVRFSEEQEKAARRETEARLAEQLSFEPA